MANNIILFDIDGVLADFILGYTKLGMKMGFLNHAWSTLSQREWDMPEIPKMQQSAIWEKIKQDSWFWTELEPLQDKNTFEEINDLECLGSAVYFVTSRPGVNVKNQTELWLKERGILRPTVLISSLKGQIASGLKATHLIDDKAGNCVYVAYESPRTQVYLLDREYNRFDPSVIGRKVMRIPDIKTFLEAVK